MYSRASAAVEALLGLSLTTVALLALAVYAVVVLRRKGYGVRVGVGAVVLTAHPSSRRFPEGVDVRVSTRLLPFFLGGCRGPWLDVCADRFFMRLRPAPKPPAGAAGGAGAQIPAPVWLSPWRRLKKVSTALSVDDRYWRVVLHNVTVHLVVFLLRGIRLRADHVHVWRQGAHWSIKAEQLVYVGAAEGIFGSRYDFSVNELLLISERYPLGATPRPPTEEWRAGSELAPAQNIASSCAANNVAPTQPESSTAAADSKDPLSSPASPSQFTPEPRTTPLRISLDLRKGIYFSAHLTPRALTILRPRRMAIMDDFRLSADIRDIVIRAGSVFTFLLEKAALELCPGYSRSLRAKLPPSAPSTRRPRKPGLLRYWECTGSVTRVYARLVPPHMEESMGETGHKRDQGSKSPRGLFARLHAARFDACGMAADERQEAMSKAKLEVQHVYAGSIAVETTARTHCEALAHFAPPLSAERLRRRRSMSPMYASLAEDLNDSSPEEGREQNRPALGSSCDADESGPSGRLPDGEVEDMGHGFGRDGIEHADERSGSDAACEDDLADEDDVFHVHAPPLDVDAVSALESFVQSRPEAVLWIADFCTNFDMNCAKRDAVRFDIHGDGAVAAVEPAGLFRILRNAIAFNRIYSEQRVKIVSSPSGSSPAISGAIDGDVAKAFRAGAADHADAPEAFAVNTSCGEAAEHLEAVSRSPPTTVRFSINAEPTKEELDIGEIGDRALTTELANDDGEEEVPHSVREITSDGTSLLMGCDLKRVHFVVLGDGPVGEGDTLALIFGVEEVNVPRIILSGGRSGGARLSIDAHNLRMDHWSQWTRSANLVCDMCSFNNFILHDSEKQRRVRIAGLLADWNMDLQSALEELPERFVRLAKVSKDPELLEFTRKLYAYSESRDEGCDTSGGSELIGSSVLSPLPVQGMNSGADLPTSSPGMGIDASSALSALRNATMQGMSMASSHIILADEAALAEIERKERRERRRKRFMETLQSWVLSGTDITLAASFADGPRMVARSTNVPAFSLADEWYVCRHVTVTLRQTRIVYGAEVRLENPIHTMSRTTERRRLHIVIHCFRGVLRHDYWFGQLLQDWILRLKAVLKVGREARYKRKGLPLQRFKKKPFPDLLIRISDCEFSMEDHPIGAFLTRALPLMQDEALEREKRYKALNTRLDKLRQAYCQTDHPFPDTGILRAHSSLRKMDADIYVSRMKRLQSGFNGQPVAPGYIAPLQGHAMAKLTAARIGIDLVMDEATKKDGSLESIRKLRKYDSYLLGPQKFAKSRQYEVDAWNSIGFRDCNFEAAGIRLSFRDHPAAFVSIDRMYLENGAVLGQAVQGSVPPYIARATVGIGHRRVVNVTRGIGPSRMFFDCHLIVDHLQCDYNPAYLPAIADFFRAMVRFSAGGKNPSPRIPWFDSVRSACHGRFRITAKTLTGKLSSSVSPYTLSDHYVTIKADDVTMFTSRLASTKRDRYPISWEVHNWRIWPRVFRDDVKSSLFIHYTKVSLNPVPSTLSGDPQDHYFMPFPSREEVLAGGPGIGRAKMQLVRVDLPVEAKRNRQGNYTLWTCPFLEPNHDSYADFKTHKMHLGIDIHVRQAPAVDRPSTASSPATRVDQRVDKYWTPLGASVLHSDAVTTLIKVVNRIVRRPVSNRAAPRWIDSSRKPPCRDGLSVLLMSLDLDADVQDLNVMFYDNMRRGNGLFVSVKNVSGGMSKIWKYLQQSGRTQVKQSTMIRRVAQVQDVYTAMRMPKLELADNRTNCGFLFSLESVQLLSIDRESGVVAEYKKDCIDTDDARFEKLNEDIKDIDIDSRRGASRRHVSRRRTSEPSFLNESSAWFGEDMKGGSPFYTFSSKHPLQRSKKLDKVIYKEALLVDGIRILWTPMRRDSVIAWPDVFREKVFAMRGARPVGSQEATLPSDQSSERRPSTEDESQQECENRENHSEGRRTEATSDELQPDFVVSIPDQSDGTVSSSGTRRDKYGSLLDLLTEHQHGKESSSGSSESAAASDSDNFRVMGNGGSDINGAETKPVKRPDALVSSIKEVLDTNAKFQLKIRDSQVCFGSPETAGLLFFTSESACVGFVDKTIQQTHQCGGSSERWIDTEYRVLLRRSRLYSRSNEISTAFDEHWVPKEPGNIGNSKNVALPIPPMTLVTVEPISLHMMYIRSRSITRDDEADDVDHILRPSLLFINVPLVRMDSTSVEFHCLTDVVRKVLMRRMPNSDIVKDELAALRYNLHIAGGPLSTAILTDYVRRLSNITKQLMYAGDTFQEHLVRPLIRKDAGDFQANLVRYWAKSKAVATYLRSEHRARGASVLYPTMYISYSFDNCSWNLRDKSDERKAFVELRLEHLVCRHIFYIGKGSSAEFTFRDIAVVNHLTDSDFKGVLYPSKDLSPGRENHSRIKASDGTPVAFRWSATQMESVGGIPVYDVLTINLAPLNASVTSQLSEAVLEFAFGKPTKLTDVARSRGATSASSSAPAGARTQNSASQIEDAETELRGPDSLTRTVSTGTLPLSGSSSVVTKKPAALSLHERSLSQDVEEMHQRGRATMLFRYIYIGEFELTASYRKNESTDSRNRFLDIDHLAVNLPSYMYSSQVWTWADFANQIKRELLFTFAFRGVSNLAKIKLLPGYQRAHRGMKHGAEIVKQGRRLVMKASSTGDKSVDSHVEVPEDMEPPTHADSDEEGSDRWNSGDDVPPTRAVPSPHDEEADAVSVADKQILLLGRLYGARLSRYSSASCVSGANTQDPCRQISRTAADEGSRRDRNALSDGSLSSAATADGRAAKPPRLAYFRRRQRDGP